MKKLLTSSLLLLTFSFSLAKADLLYFMTDAYDPSGWKYFDYAMIGVAQRIGDEWAVDWGEGGSKMYLHLYDSANAEIGGSSGAATESQVAANIDAYTISTDPESRFVSVGWADVSGYTSGDYRFYVETYSNDDDDPIWQYGEDVAKSYAELVKDGHIYNQGTNPQDVTPWAVPEPSSGLLLLIGAGLAAWRRRRGGLVRSIGVDKIDRRR